MAGRDSGSFEVILSSRIIIINFDAIATVVTIVFSRFLSYEEVNAESLRIKELE